MKTLLILSLALVSASAHAGKFSVACGEGSDKGPAKAELGYVDDTDGPTLVYFKAKKIAEEKYAVTGRGEDYIITIFGKAAGGKDVQFVVDTSAKKAQEFIADNGEKKSSVGKKKSCEIIDEDSGDEE